MRRVPAPSPREVGSQAEDRAARYLLGLGYTLVARRVKTRSGELDIVAMDGDVLVLAEVRSRKPGAPPEASLGPRKVARLRRAAREYLMAAAGPDIAWRFDLVALEGDEIRHVPGVLWD
jgi:putative endonuclease